MPKVYFIGAGATKAVSSRAPLNNEILDAIYNDTFEESMEKSKNEIIKFIDRVFHRNKTERPLLEDVLSFIDFNIRRKSTTLRLYNYDDLIKIKNDIVGLIGDILKRKLSTLDSDATNEFIRKIGTKDTIISTNYDIIIDNALLSVLKNVNYGVRVRKNIFPLITLSDGERRAGNYIMHEVNVGNIKLLKLHGSLNWLFCPRCNEIDVTIGTKGAAEYLGQNYKFVCSNSNCTAEYEPLIVTPTKYKIYENRILSDIWDIAKKSLKSADEIIFIGYSLPEADTEIKCLLLNALNEAKKKAKITFVDVQGGSDDIINYKRLFGAVKHIKDGFIVYVESLPEVANNINGK